MNQHTGDMTAAILAGCKRPSGLLTAEIPGYTAKQLGRMIQKLQSAGLVHRAQIGGKFGRYFDSAERAAAYAQQHATIQATATKTSQNRLSPDLEVVNPRNIKPTKIPCQVRNKFAADEAPPMFSALKPGQYLAPAPVWLQGVAA